MKLIIFQNNTNMYWKFASWLLIVSLFLFCSYSCWTHSFRVFSLEIRFECYAWQHFMCVTFFYFFFFMCFVLWNISFIHFSVWILGYSKLIHKTLINLYCSLSVQFTVLTFNNRICNSWWKMSLRIAKGLRKKMSKHMKYCLSVVNAWHLSYTRFKRFNTMTVRTQWSDEQINMKRLNRKGEKWELEIGREIIKNNRKWNMVHHVPCNQLHHDRYFTAKFALFLSFSAVLCTHIKPFTKNEECVISNTV